MSLGQRLYKAVDRVPGCQIDFVCSGMAYSWNWPVDRRVDLHFFEVFNDHRFGTHCRLNALAC